jgi:hypothetical protein
MKFLETHFEDYVQTSKKQNLHPKLEKIFNNFPNKLSSLKNIIFYGPAGIGKYTQMLKSIKQYSPSELKYEKKISILFNKEPFFLKISDIHYEIDISLLGCNSKLLWHDIYSQLVDIMLAKNEKQGIIVCKYFHEIHSELLEIFYSYMQKSNILIDIKFIIITEQISFIPDNILNCCEIISISRPSKSMYSKCIKSLNMNTNTEDIINIKNIHTSITNLMKPHKIICNKIINEIVNNNISFLKFRDMLYDIFIYHLDITDCIWYILKELIKQNKIQKKNMSKLLIRTYIFLQYYNNNYRPIYHLESYLLYLVTIINEYNYKKCM